MGIRKRLMLLLITLTATVALVIGAAILLVSASIIKKNRMESIENIAYSNGTSLSEFINSDYGGIAGSVPQGFIETFICHMRFGKTGLAYIVDFSGNVIYHTDPGFVGTTVYIPVSPSEYRPGARGSSEYTHEGVKRVMGYYIIEGVDLMLVVRQDYSEIFASLNSVYFAAGMVLVIVLAFAAAAGVFISSAFTRPIYILNEAFLNTTIGTSHVLCDIKRNDEFGQLAKNYNVMMSALEMSFAELQSALGKIKHLAMHDPMTGLVNRAGFDEKITDKVTKGVTGGIFFFDLDNFKQMNDEHGHDCGDKLLIEISGRILRFGWLGAARIGGDEFVMLMEGSRSEVEDRAKAFLEAVSSPAEIEGQSFHVSGSLGVAVLDGKPADVSKEMKRADEAMYRAKANGKSTYFIA